MSGEFSNLRVLITHEWLLEWAGAERTLAEIVNVLPHADVVVGAIAPHMRESSDMARRARETWLGALPGARVSGDHRWLIPLQFPAFRTLDTTGYDLVISSSHGFSKAVRAPRGAPHLCYCYSPPRYLWDMANAYKRREGGFMARALNVGAPALRAIDRDSAAGVSRFIGISKHVAKRIRLAYNRDAGVVYPPVSAKPAPRREGAREDFLLVLGRLVSYKRVDLAVAAAEKLGIPLVVAGSGPERPRLEAMAGKHTKFVGEVDERAAGDLMERCKAFVFCAEEDFGIAPLEANAHGAPVVGLGRGALLETMTANTTAEFFPEQTVESVAAAITSASAREWDSAACRRNAERFSAGAFRAAFADAIRNVIERRT